MSSFFLSFPALALLAFLVEAILGYPQVIFRRIGHPVSWIGKLIAFLDNRWNTTERTDVARLIMGFTLVLILISLAVGLGILLHRMLSLISYGWIIEIVIASTLIASRSLATHISAVATALETDGLEAGRTAVSQVVGREPTQLDRHGVSRAAIESLAENFSDGVVAPLFWCAVAGLPGLILYKAINTADSMIGHRNEHYEYFGKAAARLDDVLNIIPARLCALLLALAAIRPSRIKESFKITIRDASHHLSPNAGWPEAAMAGALNLRLGGPRLYGTTRTEGAWLGEGNENATPDDIGKALSLYRLSCFILASLLLLITLWSMS